MSNQNFDTKWFYTGLRFFGIAALVIVLFGAAILTFDPPPPAEPGTYLGE